MFHPSRGRNHRLTAIARNYDEVVTVTWIDEAALGPIGWHSTASAGEPIPNQATARRIVLEVDMSALIRRIPPATFHAVLPARMRHPP
jgi:hypothetical protein